MSTKAEYRTKNNSCISIKVSRDALRAVEHIPAAEYNPVTEAAAMRHIGHDPSVGAVTVHDWDGDPDDVVTAADIVRMSKMIESGEI